MKTSNRPDQEDMTRQDGPSGHTAPDERNASARGFSQERKVQLREFLDRIEDTPPVFEDERLAPPVDRDVLVSLVRRQLPKDEARLIYGLIYAFKSWCDAHTEVVAEEHQKKPK